MTGLLGEKAVVLFVDVGHSAGAPSEGFDALAHAGCNGFLLVKEGTLKTPLRCLDRWLIKWMLGRHAAASECARKPPRRATPRGPDLIQVSYCVLVLTCS